MITKNALNSSLALTELLDRNNAILAPIPGTPLDALVTATRVDAGLMNKDLSSNKFVADMGSIEYITNAKDDVLGTCQHDTTMDTVVDMATKAVRGHMLFARNIVAPVVAELVEKTRSTLESTTVSSLLGINIVTYSPPAPLLDSGFESAVRKFEDTPYDSPRLNMKSPDISFADMQELMVSGSSSLDNSVREWIATKGEGFFLKLWEDVFQSKPVEFGQTGTSFEAVLNDSQCGIDAAIAVFLIARKTYDNPLPGTEMALGQYQDLMVEYRNQSALRICYFLNALEATTKSGMLVRSLDKASKTIVVNEQLYKWWLDNGGDNDVLMGNMLENDSVATVEQLNAKAEVLKAKWNHYAMLTATVENSRKFERTKQILLSVFIAQLKEVDEAEEMNEEKKMGIVRRFEELLTELTTSDLDNIYATCLRLVCRARYSYTEAERILDGIERVKKDNPSVEVREAAAISILEYIAYWVSSQMKVVAV